MNKTLKDTLIIAGGWFFIILGILGLFLPVLQGILFLFIGLYLLSKRSPLARRIMALVKRRFPRLAHRWQEARRNLSKYRNMFKSHGPWGSQK